MPNSKVIRKIRRSLLERFQTKITIIDESKDVDKLKFNELVGKLQTYEANHYTKNKSKGFILNTKTESIEIDTNSESVMKQLQTLSNITRTISYKKGFGE